MDPAAPDAYTERLRVPWVWWPTAAMVTALLAGEIHAGYAGVRAWLPYLALGLIVGIALLLPARTKIRVADGELWAGDAHLPVEVMAQVRALEPVATRRLLGRDANPAAYAVTRGYIRTAVFVRLDDPGDDTPYWVVSTRHPQRLASVLTAAGARATPTA